MEFNQVSKFHYLGYITSRIGAISTIALCLGLSVFVIVNINENPIIEHVDAGALFQDTASRISQNMTNPSQKIVENIAIIEDSIMKVDFAIAYAKKNNLKEYYSNSNVEYISTLVKLKQKLLNLKSQKYEELKVSVEQNPLPSSSGENFTEVQEINVLLTSMAN